MQLFGDLVNSHCIFPPSFKLSRHLISQNYWKHLYGWAKSWNSAVIFQHGSRHNDQLQLGNHTCYGIVSYIFTSAYVHFCTCRYTKHEQINKSSSRIWWHRRSKSCKIVTRRCKKLQIANKDKQNDYSSTKRHNNYQVLQRPQWDTKQRSRVKVLQSDLKQPQWAVNDCLERECIGPTQDWWGTFYISINYITIHSHLSKFMTQPLIVNLANV